MFVKNLIFSTLVLAVSLPALSHTNIEEDMVLDLEQILYRDKLTQKQYFMKRSLLTEFDEDDIKEEDDIKSFALPITDIHNKKVVKFIVTELNQNQKNRQLTKALKVLDRQRNSEVNRELTEEIIDLIEDNFEEKGDRRLVLKVGFLFNPKNRSRRVEKRVSTLATEYAFLGGYYKENNACFISLRAESEDSVIERSKNLKVDSNNDVKIREHDMKLAEVENCLTDPENSLTKTTDQGSQTIVNSLLLKLKAKWELKVALKKARETKTSGGETYNKQLLDKCEDYASLEEAFDDIYDRYRDEKYLQCLEMAKVSEETNSTDAAKDGDSEGTKPSGLSDEYIEFYKRI